MPRQQHTRRLLAPEVVQTSAMDCGPAALKCLLDGHGIHVSYARLRDACQTDVDGSSIDTMEVLANQLGLDAEQVLVPADHLAVPEAGLLPAIAVVTLADRQPHFVVIWRRHGPIVQVMDPSGGRRWTTWRQLLGELYHHQTVVPAHEWRTWAGTAEFTGVLTRRLATVGVARSRAGRLVDAASADPSWAALARLDAATRLAEYLVDEGALARRGDAPALVERLVAADTPPDVIPDRYWSAVVAPADDGGGARLEVRGAVFVRVRGRARAAAGADPQSDAAHTAARASLLEPRPTRPFVELVRLLRHDAGIAPAALVAVGLVASGAVVVEALLFRAALELGRELATVDQRLLAMGALVGFVLLVAGFEVAVRAWTLSAGRRLETRLRTRFFEKVRRLGDRYFRSRLTSDLASRVHNLHTMRELPPLAERAVRVGGEMLATTAGLVWIDPASATFAVALVIAVGLTAGLATPVLAELDLRLRTHAGALSRYYLDALLGLVPIRVHGAERPLRREYERVVREWTAAGRSLVRAAVTADALQMAVGYGLAAWLIIAHLERTQSVSLLLVFWALRLPVLADELAEIGRLYPTAQNVMLRVLEPLSAPGEPAADPEPTPADAAAGAAAIAMRGVEVQAAGRTILAGIDLDVAAGSHVAVIGASGAGKSTLAGLLLGWHQPSRGVVAVDGEPLDARGLAALRRRTVWVDPAVHLWNQSLLRNIQYGNEPGAGPGAGFAVAAADLQTLVQTLPDGLQTPLGEGGALVSGGEGQRVRLARGLLRDQVRLVVLDEPFRGLARDSRQALLRRVRDTWRHATVICISHDIGETLEFDRVLVLERGAVVEDGAPRQLAGADSRYRTLLVAERDVRERLWSGPMWRRVRIDGGRLVEVSEPGS